MKIIISLTIIAVTAFNGAHAGGAEIVAAARAQIGIPYIFGGGDINGKTKGGFDCSGLTLYAVHKGTGKTLAHSVSSQFSDPQCASVPYGQHVAGDLVFFGTYHVGIMTGPNTVIHAPDVGRNVEEKAIWTADRQATVKRC